MTYKVSGKIQYDFDNAGQLVLKGHIDNMLQQVLAPVLPYAFVESKQGIASQLSSIKEVYDWEGTELRAPDTGREVIKFYAKNPKDIAVIRQKLNNAGYRTYESDISYIRRLLHDRELIVDYSKDNIVYLDIENDDSKGFPSEYGKHEIVSVAVYDSRGNGQWFFVDDYNNEQEMLSDLIAYLIEKGMTVIVGWNVQFDYNHLFERMRNLRMFWEMTYLQHCNTIDLMAEYMGAVKGLSSYSLEEVSKHEGFEKIKHREMSICQMRKNRSLLKEYNMYDAELLYLIDKEYGFTDVKFEVAKQTNLTLDIMSQTRIGDALIIWRLRELGYVAKDKSKKKKERYQGAIVLEPQPGLYSYVGYYDVNSLYPNVIIYKNIDIEDFNGEVMPYIERMLLEDRAKYKKLYKETKDPRYNIMQNAKKILANGLYGLFGTPSFRYYDKDKAYAITSGGREVLLKIKDFVENQLGLKVLYGDTDSVFVHLAPAFDPENADIDAIKEFGEFVKDEINENIVPFQVKMEALMTKILFFKSVSKGGVKKRYVGITDKGTYVVRGLEVRRSDWSELTKEVMWRIFDMILKEGKTKKDVMAYLRQVKKNLYAGKYDDKIVLAKSLSKAVSDYKATPPHVRAYLKAKKRGYEFVGEKIRYVWVKGGDVEPVYHGVDLSKLQIDYDTIWETQIMSPVRRILDSIGAGKDIKLDSFFKKK